MGGTRRAILLKGRQRIGWHISELLIITRNHRPLSTGHQSHLAHLVPGDNSPRLARLCWLRTDQGPNRRQSDMIAQALIV